MLLLFFNSFSSPIQKNINLLSLSLTLIIITHQLIIGNIKTNNLRTLSNYPIKYLEIVFELVFLSINFEITILSILTFQIFIYLSIIYLFLCSINFFLLPFSHKIPISLYYHRQYNRAPEN